MQARVHVRRGLVRSFPRGGFDGSFDRVFKEDTITYGPFLVRSRVNRIHLFSSFHFPCTPLNLIFPRASFASCFELKRKRGRKKKNREGESQTGLFSLLSPPCHDALLGSDSGVVAAAVLVSPVMKLLKGADLFTKPSPAWLLMARS